MVTKKESFVIGISLTHQKTTKLLELGKTEFAAVSYFDIFLYRHWCSFISFYWSIITWSSNSFDNLDIKVIQVFAGFCDFHDNVPSDLLQSKNSFLNPNLSFVFLNRRPRPICSLSSEGIWNSDKVSFLVKDCRTKVVDWVALFCL